MITTKVLKELALQFVIFIVIVISLELGLRLFDFPIHQIPRAEYRDNLLGDFTPNLIIKSSVPAESPYSFSSNNQGFRGLSDIDKQKTPGSIRILCLGDSFTFGWGVSDENTIPERLLAKLKKKFPSKKIEVINAGIYTTGILDHLDYYLYKGIRLNPDLILLQFYVNDVTWDITQNQIQRQTHRLATQPNYLEMLPSVFLDTAIINAVIKLKVFLFHDKQAPRVRPEEALEMEEDYPLTKYLVELKPEEIGFQQQEVVLNEYRVNESAPIYQSYAQALDFLANVLAPTDTELLVYTVPSHLQLYRYLNGPEFSLARLLGESRAPLLNTIQPLRDSLINKDLRDLYIPGDNHTTGTANEIIADNLAAHIDLTAPDGTILSAPKPTATAKIKTLDLGQVTSSIRPDHPMQQGVSVKRESSGLKLPTIGSGVKSASRSISNIKNGDDDGLIKFHITSEESFSTIDLVAFLKLFHDTSKNNAITINFLAQEELLKTIRYRSRGTDRWDSNENIKMVRFESEVPLQQLTIEIKFAGDSGIVFESDIPPLSEVTDHRVFMAHLYR